MNQMWRVLTVGLVAAFVGHVAQPARASTLTYDLTLSNIVGPTDGNGTLIVNGPLTYPTDTLTSNNGGLDVLDIKLVVNGVVDTFTLADQLTTSSVTFTNGALTNVSYIGVDNTGQYKLDLLTTGQFYLFVDPNNWSLSSIGTITAVAAPSVAPLPTTSVLFATGLLGLAFLVYRRRPSARQSSAVPVPA
jgi:hypothetical protein